MLKSCLPGNRYRPGRIGGLITAGGLLCVALTATAENANSQIISEHILSFNKPQDSVSSAAELKKILSRRISVNLDEVTIARALSIAAESANVRIIFNDKYLDSFKSRVNLELSNTPLSTVFEKILTGTNLQAVASTPTTIVVRPRATNITPGKDTSVKASGIITGQVVDSATRKPISGATVVIVESQRAASTNEDGVYRFTNVPVGAHTLSVRLLGYRSQMVSAEISNDNQAAHRMVSLSRSSTTLTEVVTTATGSQRRAEISNDVVVINADKLTQAAPVRDVTDLLVAAQVPGMTIQRTSGQPGAPSRIRLGGVGSISQNNDPVVIVDGVWIKSAFSTEEIQRRFPRGGMNGSLMPSRLDEIDPATIETIEIVRGPAAATLYGPDAANGVIKITTKKGSAGPARWDFRVGRDWSSKAGKYPEEYYAFGTARNSSLVVECSINNIINNVCTQDSVVTYDRNNRFLGNEGMGSVNTFSASVSGGSPLITYRLSATVKDELGTRRNPGVDEVRFRKLNLPLSSRLANPSVKRDRGVSASLTFAPRQGLDVTVNVDGYQSNGYENSIVVRKGTVGEYARNDTISLLTQNSAAERNINLATNTTALLNVLTNWNPVSWWSGNITLGMDRGYSTEKLTGVGHLCVTARCEVGSTVNSEQTRKFSVYTARTQSSFFPSLGWASRFITVRPGITADLRREINTSSYTSITTPPPNANSNGINGGIVDPSVKALAGIGANVYIRLFDRISFDPALRRDFGSGKSLRNNAKTYPRFGTSWLVSDESFFPKSNILNSLRVRAAMGYAAVQPNLGAIYGDYRTGSIIINGITQPIYSFDGAGNTQLEPERSFEFESGFDADLLYDRVQFTFTHSSRRNTNTLISRTLAPSAGTGVAGQRQENLAKVVNRLTSMQLNALVLDKTNLTLRVGANVAIHDNQIKTLGPGVSPFGDVNQRYVVGYPVGGLWIKPILAVNDVNGNGLLEPGEIVIGDTAVYAGTNMPRYTTGYNLEISAYRNFTFNAFFDYKGSYVQNRGNIDLWKTVRGRWDASSPLEDQARALLGQTNDMQNISELRFQTASLTWNAPAHLVQRVGGRSLQVSVAGSNLKLWTRYRGRDPAVNSSPVGEKTQDDGSLIPYPRSFSLQFRVGY